MANPQLSETLKQLRKKTGLSQEKVAIALGIKKGTLGSWEFGKSEPDALMLMRLLKFYGVNDVYSIFGMGQATHENAVNIEKYNQLTEDHRAIVDTLIDGLLDLQSRL